MYLKPQRIVNEKLNKVIAFLLFAFSLGIYVLTMARSLSFWDCGEYITCSSILGVPHPPGNPFYILLGRFFTAIAGDSVSHAIVVNFMSAIFSSLAVMLTYLITVKLVSMWQSKDESWLAYLCGIIAAMYTAFSYSFWHNAIEAEVYGGLAFTINLIIYITLLFVQKNRDFSHQNYLLLVIYLFFLGFGIHQTVLQIAPAILYIAVYPQLSSYYKSERSKFWTKAGIYLALFIVVYFIFNAIGAAVSIPDLSKISIVIFVIGLIYFYMRKQVSTKAWIIALILVSVALSTHIFLLVRSAHRPFINEGHPHNWELFKNYVFRTQYGVTSFVERNAGLWNQLNHSFLRYFGWQFFHADTIAKFLALPVNLITRLLHLLAGFLGFYGMYYTHKKNKHAFNYLISLFFMASFAMIFVMNQKADEVRDRDYFFVTAYNLWAIWMAIGSIGLFKLALGNMKKLGYVVLVIMLILPGVHLASHYWVHDRHKEFIALDYGLNILNSLEENAIIFTNGDNDTFPVWYAQAVYDPYSIEHVWEESDVKPGKKTEEMIESALAFKNGSLTGVRQDVSVANLSLLNTPWYIKQLRDKEGIEFNMPDSHIEGCQTNPNSALYPRRLPKDTTVKFKGNEVVDDFSIKIDAGEALYTNDLAVIQIVKDNYGKRPIYFAVTVADVPGFKMNLRNEGMVDRLVSKRDRDQYNIKRLSANIDSVYSYRTIFDDTVYKDPNMLRLLNNYGAAFMRASTYYQSRRDYDNAIKYMEGSLPYISQRYRFYRNLAQLYLLNGEEYLSKGLADTSDTSRNNIDIAFKNLERAVYYNRNDEDLLMAIYSVGKEYELFKETIDLLTKVKKDPNSSIDKGLIEEMIGDLKKNQQG